MMSIIFELTYSYIIISLVGIACLLFVFFSFVRDHAYIAVNCWFCNSNFKVPFAIKDEWFCKQCKQFNGFKEDGDYNRILPAQFNEAFNQQYAKPAFLRSKYTFGTNRLCKICNTNQELKIKQLAMYVPFREENYDEEINIFKKKLENSYKLCENCENLVEKVLQRESSSSFFAENARSISESSENQKTSKMLIKKKWIFIFLALTLLIFAATAFEVKFLKKWETGLLLIYNFENALMELLLRLRCGIITDVTLALCVGISTSNIFRSGQPAIAVIAAAFVLMMSEDLLPFLKVSIAIVLTIFWCVKHFFYDVKRVYIKPLQLNLANRFLKQNTPMKENICGKKFISQGYSTNSNSNVPLCGRFSNMSLGTSGEFAPQILKQSYLFKPPKLLIEPSKLTIGDHYDIADQSHTSPTISSGYESVTSFFKKIPDTVSEFDSVSQVGYPLRNNHSWFVEKPSSYCTRETSRQDNTERYYGVSSAYLTTTSSSLSNKTSHIHVDAKVPILQIVLCSIMCFILGFTFQTFVSEVYFY